jgi:hypothetical protein
MTISKKTEDKVKNLPIGTTFTYQTLFVKADEYAATAKALERLIKKGLIKRVSTGVFYKPKQTIFGELMPREEELLKNYLFENGKRIAYITGLSLYNKLGLTTQVPKTIKIVFFDAEEVKSLGSQEYAKKLMTTIGTQKIPVSGTSTILIPLQTWVSIIATVNSGNSLDIYINGKLVQTTALDNGNVYGLPAGTINVGGGIDGYISSTFDSTPFGPQDAWNTYSSGYGSGGGSSISDFFNKYKVRFAFVKDNVELSRLDI